MSTRELPSEAQLTGLLFDFTLPGGDPASGIFFDAALTIAHSREAAVTMYPIEEGADVADHRRKGPATITIEGLFTNTSLEPQSDEEFAIAYAEVSQDDRDAAIDEALENVNPPEFDLTRAREAYARLLTAYENDEILSLTTPLELYPRVVITSIGANESAENGDSLPVTIVVQEFRIASSETAELPPEEPAPAAPKRPAVEAGPKTPEPIEESAASADWDYGVGWVDQVAPTIPAPL